MAIFNLCTIYSQQFPVQIISSVQAPVPVNFYNYADDTSLNSPIRVQIFLNDLTISNRRIRLKTYFEGGNISFQSKDIVFGAEDLYLDGGIPLILGNAELAPYYKYQNIQGIGAATYGQSIPEGSYNFCFEVYDYLTGFKLSDKKCTTVYIFKNEPPILNLPFNETNIIPNDFENIVFQWTPRHINVSNVEYEISIVEIWDDYIAPETAFLSQIPIYQETTRTTTLIYGPDKPLLLPDKKYAWRVQAKALQGIEEIGLFKNEGYSEIFWFSRTSPCQVPQNISAEAKGLTKINIFWDEDPTVYSDYIIAYREANKEDAFWFTKKTNSSWATIWDLKPGTTYEYKIKGKCTYQYSEFSNVQEVTTDVVQNEDANYQCGIVPDEVAISNREPHPGLNAGDQISAGDFNVVITDINSQSSGMLSGEGYVSIPYLNMAKFAVNFTNILVNTNNQLAEGEIVTVYDPEFGEGASMTVDVNVNISEGVNGDDGEIDELVEVDFVIESITIDANGAFVITGTNGEEAIVPGNDDVTIKGSNGDVWSVGEDGTITKEEGADGGAVTADSTNGIGADGNVETVTAEGVLVTFEESGYYSFDALPEGTSSSFEEQYKIINTKAGNKYNVAYKAISDTNGEDFINANVSITDDKIVKDSIVFKTKDGAKVIVDSWNGNTAKLKLQRKFHYADEEIYATIKNENGKYDVAGTLITTHLASQELEPINIKLVPVGTTISEGLISRAKEIYAKAGVTLNISAVDPIDTQQIIDWDIDGDQRLSVGDSKALSHYTNEEKVFNNYIKNQSYYSAKTYYVFVTNVSTTDAEVDGFMPLKRQFGYVFTKKANTVEEQSRTLAHELGHGIFGLEHTWDEYSFPQGATNFLMDYGNGTVLNHLDWKKMHAPGLKLYWFQGDEDGQSVSTSLDKTLAINEKKYSGKYYYGYLTPSGERIVLSGDYTPIFYHGISNDIYNKIVPGTLIGFKKDITDEEGNTKETKYWAEIEGTEFKGYKAFSYEAPSNISDDNNKSVIIGLPYGNSDEKLLWKNYKFKELNRPDYTTSSKSIVDITTNNFQQLSLFKDHLPFKEKIYTNTSKITGEGQIDVTQQEIKLLSGYYNEDISMFFQDIFNLSGRSSYQISHNERREVFLIIKIAEIYNRYPQLFKDYTQFFDNWDLVGFSDFTLSYGKWDKDNLLFEQDKFNEWLTNFKMTANSSENNLSQLYDFYQNFLIGLLQFVNEGATANAACLTSSFEFKTGVEVFECIQRASQYELRKISLPNKIFAIKKILEIPIVGNDISDENEIEVARILQAISEGSSSTFGEALNYFKTTEVTYTYVDYSGYAESSSSETSTVPLWYALFNNIEDQIFIFGENNRQSIVQSLGKIFLQDESEGGFVDQLKKSIAPEELKKIMTLRDLKNLHSYFYTFENDYQNIFRRGWSDIAASTGPVGLSIYDTEDFYKSVDTRINSNNYLIQTEQKVKWGLFNSEVLKSENLAPFQLVSFINISKNNLLKPFTAKDENGNPQAIFVPALTMHYASKTDQLQTQSDLIQTAVDLLAFLPSGGTAALSSFGKFVYYADKISSVSSMAGTAFRETNPQLSGYMNQLSMVSGLASLGSFSKLSKAENSSDLNKTLDDIMHPNALSEANNPVENINQLAEGIVSNQYDVSKLTPDQATASKKIMQNELESLKDFPSLNTVKIESAITKLDEFVIPSASILPSSVVDATLASSEKVRTALGNFNSNNIDGFIDIIIHGADNKFILDLPEGILELETSNLVSYLITNSNFADARNFRLLSCSNMELAEELVSLFPTGKGYKVRATDDIVRLHGDGGISTVPRGANNPVNQWEDLTLNADGSVKKTVATSPELTKPEFLADFVELGRRTKTEQFITTLKGGAFPEIWSRIDALNLSDEALLRFADDFKNVNSEDLAKLGNNNGELIDVWKKWGDPDNNLVKLSKTRIYNVDDLATFGRVYNKEKRLITFDDFFEKTISQIDEVVDIKKENYKKFAVELFEAWDNGFKNKSIAEMQAVYTKYGLDPSKTYPPNEGVWGLSELPRAPTKDELFDRFQSRSSLGGGYAGFLNDPNTVPTISARALRENYSEIVANGEDYFYFLFKMDDIPSDLKFEFGEAMPWFGEVGGAIQIKSSKALHELGDNIKIVEKWKLLPDGTWKQDFSILKTKFPENIRNVFDNASDEFFSKLNKLNEEGTLERFIDDFKDNSDALTKFKTNEGLVDSWSDLVTIGKKIDGIPQGHELRINIGFLTNYKNLSVNKRIRLRTVLDNQKAFSGYKGKVSYTANRNIDIGDGALREYRIQYDEFGYPKLESHCPNGYNVTGDELAQGNHFSQGKLNLDGTNGDMTAANKWALEKFGSENFRPLSGGNCEIKIDDNWIIHTWHHHQDGITIFPVPSGIHNTSSTINGVSNKGFPHSGGASLIKEQPEVRGFFPPPSF